MDQQNQPTKRNINIPILGYKLIMDGMDARKAKAVVRCIDSEGPCTLAEKSGYLVDMVNFLEDMGVDRHEMVIGIEEMERNDHDTAHFGTLGTFIYTAFEGLKQ